MKRTGLLLRRTAVVGVAGVLGTGSLSLVRAAAAECARLWTHRDGLAFDDLLLACALLVLALAGAWLGSSVLLTVVTESLQCTQTLAGRLARVITPPLCRGVVGGACGLAAATAPAGAVAATSAPDGDLPAARPACTTSAEFGLRPTGLPLPDRPVRATGRHPRHTVVVRPGDTLWAVAARHLPPRATDADIADAWPAWFRTNRARIGPDPHLIHPRTRLAVPDCLRRVDKDRNR